MLNTAISMQWLLELAEKYSSIMRQHPFYKTVALASCREDLQWIRQMYHLTNDFSSAQALRYALCHDQRFRACLGQHAAEEIPHPAMLVDWMREHGLLAPGEAPTSVPPTQESLALGSYFIRSVTAESIAHQIIVLNLMTERIALDFYSAVNPKLAKLGFSLEGYWKVHQVADVEHQFLGLDLIPQCEKDSLEGRKYACTAWETTSLWSHVFDSWSGIPTQERLKIPTPEELEKREHNPLLPNLGQKHDKSSSWMALT